MTFLVELSRRIVLREHKTGSNTSTWDVQRTLAHGRIVKLAGVPRVGDWVWFMDKNLTVETVSWKEASTDDTVPVAIIRLEDEATTMWGPDDPNGEKVFYRDIAEHKARGFTVDKVEKLR